MEQLNKKNIIFVDSNDDLKTVLACFKVNKISHLPVLSQNKIVGMISKTDVVEYLYDLSSEKSEKSWAHLAKEIKVNEVMIEPLVEATANDSQLTLLEKLMDHQVSSIVIKDKADIIGIVTEKDMLRYLATHFEKQTSFSEDLAFQMTDWLNKNGIIKISQMLAQIGI